MFEGTKKELKKLKILPIISYAMLAVVIGKIIDFITNLGSSSYAISSIGLPILTSLADRIFNAKLLSTFYKEWREAPTIFHLLVITNIIIYYFLLNNLKIWIKSFYNPSES